MTANKGPTFSFEVFCGHTNKQVNCNCTTKKMSNNQKKYR